MEEFRDYFETPQDIPQEVSDIIETFDEDADAYKELDRILDLLAPLGWIFEYYLDAEPFGLSPINFAWWLQSDNVVEYEGGYLTQCTQYGKKFTSEEIKQYYKREYEQSN